MSDTKLDGLIATLVVKAAQLGLTYGESRFAGVPRWEYERSFAIGNFDEALEWAADKARLQQDDESAGKFERLLYSLQMLRMVRTAVPPLDTDILIWRGGWRRGMVFISKKGKRLFTDGGFPVGPKSRWILLPDLEDKNEIKSDEEKS